MHSNTSDARFEQNDNKDTLNSRGHCDLFKSFHVSIDGYIIQMQHFNYISSEFPITFMAIAPYNIYSSNIGKVSQNYTYT